MLDVYNTVLQLARERRCDISAFSSEHPPKSMPRTEELVAALDRIYANRYEIPDVTTDPILRRGLMRMSAINNMVVEHIKRIEYEAGQLVGAPNDSNYFGSSSRITTSSGEMTCPECNTGTLCYLFGGDGGAFIECSTVGCLYWDARH